VGFIQEVIRRMRQTDSLEVSLDKLDVLRQLNSRMTCMGQHVTEQMTGRMTGRLDICIQELEVIHMYRTTCNGMNDGRTK